MCRHSSSSRNKNEEKDVVVEEEEEEVGMVSVDYLSVIHLFFVVDFAWHVSHNTLFILCHLFQFLGGRGGRGDGGGGRGGGRGGFASGGRGGSATGVVRVGGGGGGDDASVGTSDFGK